MGQWKDGNAHGKGTRIYANGNKYIGEWVGDKRTGNGVYTWASGDSTSVYIQISPVRRGQIVPFSIGIHLTQ